MARLVLLLTGRVVVLADVATAYLEILPSVGQGLFWNSMRYTRSLGLNFEMSHWKRRFPLNTLI